MPSTIVSEKIGVRCLVGGDYVSRTVREGRSWNGVVNLLPEINAAQYRTSVLIWVSIYRMWCRREGSFSHVLDTVHVLWVVFLYLAVGYSRR